MKRHIFIMMLFALCLTSFQAQRTKIPAGHERLAGDGRHGGRGALELRHGFCLPHRGGVQRLHQER